jgi:hypothetical protein
MAPSSPARLWRGLLSKVEKNFHFCALMVVVVVVGPLHVKMFMIISSGV